GSVRQRRARSSGTRTLMAQILSMASAFNPGHDLWVVTDPSASRWTLRLDWYLNFQVVRAQSHQSLAMPTEIDGILREIEWTPPAPKAKESSPLLVSCEGRLPARWVAMIPHSNNLST